MDITTPENGGNNPIGAISRDPLWRKYKWFGVDLCCVTLSHHHIARGSRGNGLCQLGYPGRYAISALWHIAGVTAAFGHWWPVVLICRLTTREGEIPDTEHTLITG